MRRELGEAAPPSWGTANGRRRPLESPPFLAGEERDKAGKGGGGIDSEFGKTIQLRLISMDMREINPTLGITYTGKRFPTT